LALLGFPGRILIVFGFCQVRAERNDRDTSTLDKTTKLCEVPLGAFADLCLSACVGRKEFVEDLTKAIVAEMEGGENLFERGRGVQHRGSLAANE
jgi:hypothetical protein